MRGKIKLVSFVLCALVMFAFALTANAAVNWNVSSNPNEVTQYGVTELMGRVRLAVAANGTTDGSTITVTYQGIAIKNTAATGITLGVTLGTNATISQVIAGNPAQGTSGQVVISITGSVALIGGTDELTLDGVRTDVSGKGLSTDIQASLSSTPSTANTFVNVSVVRVATINKALSLNVTASSSVFCLDPVNPSLTITEGFAGAFVQYVTSVGGTGIPTAFRPIFGANRNIRIRVTTSTLPTGVTLDWTPPTGGWPEDSAVGSALELISQSASGDDALFEFVTGNQSTSDSKLESFTITPVIAPFPDVVESGSSTVQVRLEPQTSATSAEIPRFDHPYINSPADTFLTVNKCTTNLLFPFLTNATGVGFYSGMAIANTSVDPYGTAPQAGPVTVYFYGTSACDPLTTPSVGAGETWAASLSTICPGFQGYVIAVAQFQFGHGFAFITGKYNSGSVYDVAEGYIANIIPDPTFTPLSGVAHRYAGPPQTEATIPPSAGENLGH